LNSIPEQTLQRIHEICPDLIIRSVESNQEGLVNDVFIINKQLVFRFVKNETGVKALAAELKVLLALRPYISLQIPNPFFTSQNVIAYPLVGGATLSRDTLLELSAQVQQTVANQLGKFLWALHHVPVDASMPVTSAPVSYEAWVELWRSFEEKIYPMLMAHQVEWARRLFDLLMSDRRNFDHQSCLIHGDLGPYHILFDRQTNQINGIIDFGVSGIGDPAIDFGNLLQVYGESFVSRILKTYPKASALMKRARFYAQTVELQWALSGITSGDTFWFLAHLGGARDLKAPIQDQMGLP